MNSEQTREILRKVRHIEIRTKRLVNDSLAGEYHSVFKGRGMNFDEVREYVPGDEVRTIECRVVQPDGSVRHLEMTASNHLADPAVPIDPECLVPERMTHAALPVARFHRGDLLRYLAHPGDDQPPGQLGGGIGR